MNIRPKIGLVQINNVFSGQTYFPYSTGLIQAYAMAHCPFIENFEFIDHIYKRMPVETAVEQLKDCSIVGFSLYVWNNRLSLAIAKRLKEVNPNVVIVCGGPHVPDEAEEWLRTNTFVTLAVHGEGEAVFTRIIERYQEYNKGWEGVPGVSYLEEGKFITRPRPMRLTLDQIPSPYLTGIFKPIMRKDPAAVWLALWETNRGCPFSCTYCDWGSSTQAKVNKFDIKRLEKEVDWFANHKIEFVFCCDANYGILPRDIDITQYVVDSKKKTGYPKALSVQNTKNATERSYMVQKLLSDGGLNKGVTLAIQTMDKTALVNIKRDNISLESYHELQRRFMRDKVETYSDMILALPGETYDTFMDGLDYLISHGQHNRIQFNNLSILPNAEMGDPEYQKKFGMITVPSKIINMHGSLDEMENDVQEMQEMVIGTDAMPKEDWVRVRAACWMSAFLHFDKLLQIPLLIVHKRTGIRFRTIFEAFMDGDYTMDRPVIDEARRFFLSEALNLQRGGSEFCQSKKWLNLFWPADEYFFIKMVNEGKIKQFYDECIKLLDEIIEEQGKGSMIPLNLLFDAFNMNETLLKLPFETEDVHLVTTYDVRTYYKAILEDEPFEPRMGCYELCIKKSEEVYNNWDEWLQKVVWYGNKKGGYLHGHVAEPQLAGHH